MGKSTSNPKIEPARAQAQPMGLAKSAHAPRLGVDLGAIAENWRALGAAAPGAETGAVVKADAYGLGLAPVARALHAAGCRTFFVAHLEEGVRLRAADGLAGITIYVLSGFTDGAAETYLAHRLEPVLNTLAEARAWAGEARSRARPLPAALQVETGMNRLGMPAAEIEAFLNDPGLGADIALSLVLSHLACADTPDHSHNAKQAACFDAIRARFPGTRASLANSGGVFLGPDFGHDVTRPGIALYGGLPNARAKGHIAPVVSLHARVLQIRELEPGETVGYGAAFRAKAPTRIATLSIGYADGLPRRLEGRGIAYFGSHPAPFAGRVSMDSVSVDVTGLPEGAVRTGDWAELLGPHQDLDTLAAAADTIGYEILTGLGRRASTHYKEARPGADGSAAT